jgi:hypothetical protein
VSRPATAVVLPSPVFLLLKDAGTRTQDDDNDVEDEDEDNDHDPR